MLLAKARASLHESSRFLVPMTSLFSVIWLIITTCLGGCSDKQIAFIGEWLKIVSAQIVQGAPWILCRLIVCYNKLNVFYCRILWSTTFNAVCSEWETALESVPFFTTTCSCVCVIYWKPRKKYFKRSTITTHRTLWLISRKVLLFAHHISGDSTESHGAREKRTNNIQILSLTGYPALLHRDFSASTLTIVLLLLNNDIFLYLKM